MDLSDTRWFNYATGVPGQFGPQYLYSFYPVNGNGVSGTTVTLTNGPQQASSFVVSNEQMPFQADSLCPWTGGAFTLRYSFSLTAPGALNSLANGLSVSFIDSSSVTPSSITWAPDVSRVLVPTPSAVTLEIDTHDDACGTSAATPCTGTSTNYDNRNVQGAGTGYRIASPKVLYNAANPLQDYVSTTLMYGGRYTSMNGGVSIANVAATGQVVNAQIDFTPTKPIGSNDKTVTGVISWFINGVQIFGDDPVSMPRFFFVGFAASVTSQMSYETASLSVGYSTPVSLTCGTQPPSPPNPPPPPSPPPPIPFGCKDNNVNCGAWAATGECAANPSYMLTNCQASCQSCVTPASPPPPRPPLPPSPPVRAASARGSMLIARRARLNHVCLTQLLSAAPARSSPRT
jgi:hypothetical protein